MNKNNSLEHINFNDPEEIHRLRDYYNVELCGLSDADFLERYVNLKKYNHLNFVSKCMHFRQKKEIPEVIEAGTDYTSSQFVYEHI